MTYLKELQKTNMAVADTLSSVPPVETLIYIHVGGRNQVELEEALDAIYLDNSRNFKLVDIKRNNNLITALVVMEKIQPVKF